MSDSVRKIVIVGGGTAGWLTAGVIAAKLKANNQIEHSVTLIESPDVPIIGVGEGTWPTMRKTLKLMGIRETDFIKRCNVAFKQGAKFEKWVTGADNDYYYHPLVLPQGFERTNLAKYWLSGNKRVSFSEAVCFQESLCELGLGPKHITTAEYAGISNYAYHLDAGEFSRFIQEHCVKNLDVHHLLDHVTQINNEPNGDIVSLLTKQSGEIPGDLFIDCTGFKSLLLGENQQVGFRSCSDVLFADKALAVHVPYENEDSPIASHTISSAQSAGWIWDIGLSTRRGVGHVYASKYISQDTAKAELLDYIRKSYNKPETLSIREIDINAGHREIFWKRNCVAVGLSAGFLEPLEASALLLVEISAEMIAEQLPATRQVMDIIAKRFNRTFLYRWSSIIDFLKLHYMLNKRTDSQFWIDHRDPSTIPESLQEQLRLWQHKAPWHEDFEYAREVFPAASYQYILYGMGFETNEHAISCSDNAIQEANELLNQNIEQISKLTNTLPSNRTLLKKIYQYGLQPI